MFTRHIKLTALDANYTATQSISIQIKLPMPSPRPSQLSNDTNKSTSSSPKLSWLNLVYFVSAINELEITYSNKTNSHEASFRDYQLNSTSDELEQTLAYLIVEKSKFMSTHDSISMEQEQLMDDVSIGNANLSLFRVNEMRNGLYSISTPTYIYSLIKGMENRLNSSIYTLKLTIR